MDGDDFGNALRGFKTSRTQEMRDPWNRSLPFGELVVDLDERISRSSKFYGEQMRAESDERRVFQSYVVLLPREAAKHRSALIADLKVRGVEAQIGMWHMHAVAAARAR